MDRGRPGPGSAATGIAFDEVCAALGYEPQAVLSIRINRREVVVAHVDPEGELRTTVIRATGPSSGAPAPEQRRGPPPPFRTG